MECIGLLCSFFLAYLIIIILEVMVIAQHADMLHEILEIFFSHI